LPQYVENSPRWYPMPDRHEREQFDPVPAIAPVVVTEVVNIRSINTLLELAHLRNNYTWISSKDVLRHHRDQAACGRERADGGTGRATSAGTHSTTRPVYRRGILRAARASTPTWHFQILLDFWLGAGVVVRLVFPIFFKQIPDNDE